MSPYKMIEELQTKITELTAEIDRLKKENFKLQMNLIEAKRVATQAITPPVAPSVVTDSKSDPNPDADTDLGPMVNGLMVEVISMKREKPVDNSAKIADLQSQLEAARNDEAQHRSSASHMTSRNTYDLQSRSDKTRTYSNSLIDKANGEAAAAQIRQKSLMTQISVLKAASKQGADKLIITAKQSDGAMIRLVADSKMQDIASTMKTGKTYRVSGLRRVVAGTTEIQLRSITDPAKK